MLEVDGMNNYFWINLIILGALLSGCSMPNTYDDPHDPYAYGLRWFDRGRYDLSVRYWGPLVAKGDCDAEYRVGLLYFFGRGKPKDHEKALELWLKAANGNHPKAQFALGDLYYQKETVTFHDCKTCGIQQDLVQAYVWYKLSNKSARYDGERKYAETILKSISDEMSSEQLTQSETIL